MADWYEEHKKELEFNIWDWIKYTNEEEKIENRQFTEWLGECENTPVETLIKMKLFGYEVEKEKQYKIKIIKTGQYLYKNGKDLFFSSYSRPEYNPRLVFTKKELEQEKF